ncbi:site-specific DNA-methyltransferase [Clostridioides difficile]|nr:site-specific DNA-methyltransferase [Clostridioides difficile]HBH3439845.1 site-specific DNA-methyltransferase [Clostridioides difficile]
MSKSIDDILSIFKDDERIYVNNEYIIGKIQELALKYDEKLISAILNNAEMKLHFFTEVGGALIFKREEFIEFIGGKYYLEDSYTKYRNKIGLAVDNSYIKENRDVVLNWAYKDCVLEGGQDREDAKQDEVFYNEILASDDIDRLFDKKILTNFKKFDENGQTSIEGIEDENLIINGNNLIVMHSLKERFKGKVKLIYIDPPFNTGDDEFNYNDGFKHSTWLTFIKNRLEVAKTLLADDGLIFVQIDSSRNNKGKIKGTSELPYLNILLDEVFGRENFVAHLHWKKKKQPSFLSKVAGVMESILIYAKNEDKVGKLIMGETTDKTKRIDNASNKLAERVISKGIRFFGEENYVIKKGKYQNKTMTTEFLDDVIIKDGRTQNEFRAIAKFRNIQSDITKFCEDDLLYITANNSFRRFKTDEEMNSGKSITDLLLDWGQNQDATSELKELFEITDDSKIFATPKPELLLHNIISCSTEEGDIVLDFFSGSATTLAVAHKLNRRYIGIEQMEDTVERIILPRMKKVISGENGGVSSVCNWNGGGSFVYCELMKWNEVFINKINNSKESNQLVEIWNEIKAKAFLSYRIKINQIDKSVNEFEALTLEQQKEILLEVLDKNHLYVNLSEIDDTTYNVSDEDKRLNKEFFGLK